MNDGNDVWKDLGELLKESGLRPYFKRPHPTIKGLCVHGNDIGPPCAKCRALAYPEGGR